VKEYDVHLTEEELSYLIEGLEYYKREIRISPQQLTIAKRLQSRLFSITVGSLFLNPNPLSGEEILQYAWDEVKTTHKTGLKIEMGNLFIPPIWELLPPVILYGDTRFSAYLLDSKTDYLKITRKYVDEVAVKQAPVKHRVPKRERRAANRVKKARWKK